MATVASAITYSRQKAQTDSNGISDTNGLAWANNGLLNITRDLIARGINAAQLQEAYTTLSPSDNPPGKFAWPTDMWMLKTVEVDYSAAGGQQYIQATKLDMANLQGSTSWDFVRLNQTITDPQFTSWGDTGEVFPTPLTSALLRIVYFLTPTEYTATSNTIVYPESLDYRILGDQILIGYYESLQDWNALQVWDARYKKKIDDGIVILAPQSQQPILPEPLHISGWQF